MDSILNKVDIENLYQHILKIEGVKHPFKAPEKLNDAADYIKSKFVEYGLQVNEHQFKLNDLDFFNSCCACSSFCFAC